MRGSDYVCDFWVAAPVHERNYTSEELEWGHVAPSAEAAGADWPVCCGAARAASCLGADSTCTAATFVSDGEVRCTVPRIGHPALLRVRLSLNGQQYTPQDMTYLAYAQPMLERSTPISGGEGGGSSLLVHGTGFRPGPLPAQHALPPLKPLIQVSAGPT